MRLRAAELFIGVVIGLGLLAAVAIASSDSSGPAQGEGGGRIATLGQQGPVSPAAPPTQDEIQGYKDVCGGPGVCALIPTGDGGPTTPVDAVSSPGFEAADDCPRADAVYRDSGYDVDAFVGRGCPSESELAEVRPMTPAQKEMERMALEVRVP